MAVEKFYGSKNKGLEGIVVCDTKVSSIVDNTLCYRGYAIEDLAEKASFEEISYLIWNDKKPNSEELSQFKTLWAKEAQLDNDFVAFLKELSKRSLKEAHPMHFLRTALSFIPMMTADADVNDDPTKVREHAINIAAKFGPIVAAYHRLKNGQELIAYNAQKSVAWNFLNQLTGKEPDESTAQDFDTCLILHIDHGLNCSTFTSKVTASTLSDVYSSVCSAIGSLKGPLHGGANEAVLKMLNNEVKSLDNVDAFVDKALSEKRKVMGIGHRLYKNGDPRAKILKKMSQRMTEKVGKADLYKMSDRIETQMLEKKGLNCNVDFYSATVYDSMNIPSEIYTPIFAMSRVVGWTAHIMEQWTANRIYRPNSEYTGQKNLSW